MCQAVRGKSLAKFIYRHTEGNPFFTRHFLTGLYEANCLKFDAEDKVWQYNLSQISNLKLSDDVVHFMVARLRRLPVATQEVLKLAACIGDRFELTALAAICEQSELEVTNNLWSALQARLIIPETEIYCLYDDNEFYAASENRVIKYRFLHDRIQQAAYTLIPQAEKGKTHYQIGQLLLKNTSKNEQEQKIFDIVNHLNFGLDFIVDSSQKDRLASLNFIASRKAKDATAYVSAAKYAKNCQYLLPQNSWDCNYKFTLLLHQLQAEILYLNGDFVGMEKLAQEVLEKSKITLDKVKIYEIRIEALTSQQDLVGAVNSGLEILEMLGVEFSNQPSPNDIDAAFKEVTAAMANREPFELLELPQMQEDEYVSAMNIMMHIIPSTHMTKPLLFPLLVLKQIYLSLSYGNAATSSFAYTVYAILLWDTFGDIVSAFEFACLGLKLSSRSPQHKLKPRTVFVAYCFSMHWKQHLSQSLQPLESAYSNSLALGDLTFAGYCVYTRTLQAFYIGKPLDKLALTTASYSSVLEEINQINTFSYNEILLQTILNLVDDVENKILLIGQAWDEKSQLPRLENANDGQGLAFLLINKLFLAYTFGDFDEARENAENAEKYLYAIGSMYIVSIFYFYYSLSQIQQYTSVSNNKQADISQAVNSNQNKMQNWAIHAPMNFQHKFDLVEAENNRVLGNKLEALELYDKAIAGAKENQYIQEEALANELAAKFYLDWGKEKAAAGYLQEAYDCYAQWGAKAKTRHLEQNYPELLRPILQAKNYAFNHLEALSSLSSLGNDNNQINQADFNFNDNFDLTAILKSAQALTETIELEKLLSKLSEIILKNSGCDRIIIALKDDRGDWQINVSGDAENSLVDLNSSEIDIDSPDKLINYVYNTQEVILVNNLETELPIIDGYLVEQKPRSLFALPLKYDEKTIGVLYLHSSYITGLFNPERIIVLEFLCYQASIALHNAQIHADANLKSKVIESSVDGMAILDNGVFTYLNERHALLSGYQPEELIGESWSKLYSPEEVDRLQGEVFASLEDTGEWNGEATALRKDGTTFTEEVRIFALDNGKQICICRDISDRKAAQDSLKASEHRYLTLAENVLVGLFRTDPLGNCLYVNHQWSEMTGLKIEQAAGYGWIEIIHPEDRQWVDTAWKKFVDETPPFQIEFECRLKRQDGRTTWVYVQSIVEFNDEGQPVGIVGTVTDISDRKASEKTLQISALRDRTIFDRSSVGFIEIDVKTQNITRANNLFCQMTGYSAEELSQIEFQTLTHLEDLENCLNLFKQLISGETDKFFTEKRFLNKDGFYFWCETTAYPIEFEGSSIKTIFGIIKDIRDRKQAELALQESQIQFQRMTENVPGMIFRYIVHPDGNDELTYVSSQIQEIYEVELQTALQNTDSMWARIHPDDISRIRKDIEISAETLQPFTSTFRLILPNKGLRWAQNMSRPELLDNGDVVWDGITVDISDRKLIEAKQQRQLDILETTSDFIGTADPQGKILYLNEAWRNLLKQDEDEPRHRINIAEQHPAWAFEIITNKALRVAIKDGMWAGETAVLDGNGIEIPVSQVVIAHKSEDGAVEYFSTISRDISDRKRAEAQLQIISDRLEVAIQSANIGIWECSFQSDCLSWNDRMFTIYGVEPQEFEGTCQDWLKHVHPDDLDSALIQPEIFDSQGSITKEFRIVRSDGEIRYIYSTAIIQKNQQGQLVSSVGVNIDITERKLAEQKLQQTNEELARATRMKDEFVANMSHELRTPLSAILGMTEGLQDGIFGRINQQQNQALDTIEQSGSHLLELIDEILDLTKIESGHVELEYSSVEVNQLCQSSLGFIKQQAQKKLIQLHLNTPFNLPKIELDERRIRQVLINLLNNAVKFTPEKGRVTLEVSISEPKKTSGLKYLRFAVQDTGIGIALEDINKLFQPFVQIDSSLNRQYDGTGLGLFLVKRIIDLHRGNVTVTSKVGVGSCFAIELPYSTVPANDITNELKTSSFSNPNQQQEIALTAPIILLAEDNSTNSSIISTYLQSKGYRLQIAHDGLSAIELAVANQPDLIIMDIQMPGMDGLTAIKHIRQDATFTLIPIIALTAFAMEEDRKKCLAAGANMYLAKPVRLKKLLQSIQKLLNTNYSCSN